MYQNKVQFLHWTATRINDKLLVVFIASADSDTEVKQGNDHYCYLQLKHFRLSHDLFSLHFQQ